MFAAFPTLGRRVRRLLRGGRTRTAVLITTLALPLPLLVGGCQLLEPDSCRDGHESCSCRSDRTCNGTLACLSGVCVNATQLGSQAPSDGVPPSEVEPVNPNASNLEPVAPPPASSPSMATSTDDVAPTAQAPTTTPGDPPNVPPTGTTPDDETNPVSPSPPAIDLANTPVRRHGQLSVRGTELVDAHGNAVQLKGISSMWLNWDPTGYGENRDGLRFMRDSWGLQIFRAAMGAALPEDNEVDDTYSGNPAKAEAQVRTIVENAIALGVYVIIDWHDHDAHERQQAAADFFARLAQDYGSYPNVLYEIYNEPLAVDWDTVIKPYHEALVSAIREHDPDNAIILGTPNWSQDVDVAALNPVAGSNLLYTLHFYSCTHGSDLRDRAEQAYQSGLPLFVTEWGATHADGGLDGIVCDAEAGAWHDWMDARKISWTAWKLDGCTHSSCFFKDRSAPADGGWTTEHLNGHASFVLSRLPTPGNGNAPNEGGNPVVGDNGETHCQPSGTCAAGDGIDCNDGEPVAQQCAGCEVLTCGLACCGRIAPLGADAEPFAARPELVQTFSQTAEAVELSMAFGNGNEFGAVTFELAVPRVVSPDQLRVDAQTSGEAIDSERLTVSLEHADAGCHYAAIQQDGAWVINGPATACWNGFGADSSVSVINVRVDAVASGSGSLLVRSVSF